MKSKYCLLDSQKVHGNYSNSGQMSCALKLKNRKMFLRGNISNRGNSNSKAINY